LSGSPPHHRAWSKVYSDAGHRCRRPPCCSS
jgi:hypothetical protein